MGRLADPAKYHTVADVDAALTAMRKHPRGPAEVREENLLLDLRFLFTRRDTPPAPDVDAT